MRALVLLPTLLVWSAIVQAFPILNPRSPPLTQSLIEERSSSLQLSSGPSEDTLNERGLNERTSKLDLAELMRKLRLIKEPRVYIGHRRRDKRSDLVKGSTASAPQTDSLQKHYRIRPDALNSIHFSRSEGGSHAVQKRSPWFWRPSINPGMFKLLRAAPLTVPKPIVESGIEKRALEKRFLDWLWRWLGGGGNGLRREQPKKHDS